MLASVKMGLRLPHSVSLAKVGTSTAQPSLTCPLGCTTPSALSSEIRPDTEFTGIPLNLTISFSVIPTWAYRRISSYTLACRFLLWLATCWLAATDSGLSPCFRLQMSKREGCVLIGGPQHGPELVRIFRMPP